MLQEFGKPNLEREYDEAIEEEMKNYERRYAMRRGAVRCGAVLELCLSSSRVNNCTF